MNIQKIINILLVLTLSSCLSYLKKSDTIKVKNKYNKQYWSKVHSYFLHRGIYNFNKVNTYCIEARTKIYRYNYIYFLSRIKYNKYWVYKISIFKEINELDTNSISNKKLLKRLDHLKNYIKDQYDMKR